MESDRDGQSTAPGMLIRTEEGNLPVSGIFAGQLFDLVLVNAGDQLSGMILHFPSIGSEGEVLEQYSAIRDALSVQLGAEAEESGDLTAGSFAPGKARSCAWTDGTVVLVLRLEALENGYPELTVRLYLRPEEPEGSDWREAYRQFIRRAAETSDDEEAYQGPVQAVGLLDLNGSGIPELILFFPGASKSAEAAVFTLEEGELRAFNADCSCDLPLAKHAMDRTVWANDQTGGSIEDQIPAFRFYHGQGDSFWLLNSGNAAWPAEIWCDWLRFGPAEDKCLACQSLLSLAVEGEEGFGGEYTETGWWANGEAVTREAYHEAEDQFDAWLVTFAADPVDPGAYLSRREDPESFPARFDALLEGWSR